MATFEILSALGHPNRIRIVQCLADGPKCNCELAPMLGLEQSNLSRHLALMVKSGLLESDRQGTRVNFRLADKRVLRIVTLAESVARLGLEKRLRSDLA
jgi:DNA-binding transcriptional ArsR family regulator